MTFPSLDIAPAYLLAVLALAFAHATFQLGISVLTLLSSHAIGAARSQRVLLMLDGSYVLGVLAATIALLSVAHVAITSILTHGIIVALWAVLTIAAILIGLLIIRFYYRRSKGTALWIPRTFAQYLTRRTKRTTSSVEAFALGIMTVVAELPFTAIVFAMTALLIVTQAGSWTGWIVGYALLVISPLLVLTVLIAGGHKVSTIQKWREANKTFLQFSSGLSLILVAVYLGVLQFGGVW